MNNEITFSKKCDIKINMGCIPAKSKSEITLQAPPNCEQLSNIANVKDLKITEGLLIQESKADIEAGRFHTDGIEEHIKRVTNV